MHNRERPIISLLATGGTIAGSKTSSNPDSACYIPGCISAEYLISTIPELQQVADLRVEQIANIGSQDMSYAIWCNLSKRINLLLQDPDINGIVITHGTDTLEETAYFLSLVTECTKPLVLVGAMRPITALSGDGAANLYNAVALAASPMGFSQGPLVVMQEDIHYAREVQKTATSGMNAFESPNRGCAGFIHNGKPIMYSLSSPVLGPASVNKFDIEKLSNLQWPRVEIIYAYSGMDGVFIDYLCARVRGIILAGLGNGNASISAMRALERAVARGVTVVRASRTGSGFILPGTEMEHNTHGFINANDLSPHKARILLMVSLVFGDQGSYLQACFDQY